MSNEEGKRKYAEDERKFEKNRSRMQFFGYWIFLVGDWTFKFSEITTHLSFATYNTNSYTVKLEELSVPHDTQCVMILDCFIKMRLIFDIPHFKLFP